MRDLIFILTPVFGVHETEVGRTAIVTVQLHPVAQGLGFLEHTALGEVVQNLFKLASAQRRSAQHIRIVLFQLALQIGLQLARIADGDALIAQPAQPLDQGFFQLRFGLVVGHSITS